MSEPPPGARPPEELTPPPPQTLPAVPDDAGDTRGKHFRQYAGSSLALVGGGILLIAAFVAGAVGVNVAVGAGAAVAVLLVLLVIIYLLARSAAESDFFKAYADGRHLQWVKGRSTLPPATPLLQRGDSRYTEERLDGVLPGGLDGTLALYTYQDESRDSDGNKQTTYYHFTVALTQLPATAPLLRELFCQRRFGFRFLDGFEDTFRKRQRVEQESDDVDKRYEIFIGEGDDMNRARQILSPTFLVWLGDNSPEAFAFELVAGALVTNIKGHKKSAGELDSFCQASAAVAKRLQAEAAE